MPVPTEQGFDGDTTRTVNLLKACEELGVNLLTTRTAESGEQRDIPLPSEVGDGLKPGIPRLLQLFKSIYLPGSNIHSTETEDLTKVNRWAGFGIGTNHLTHLEQNLEVLTRGKSERVGRFFNVDKLRGISNANFMKMSHQKRR
jgi:hypothetical protein